MKCWICAGGDARPVRTLLVFKRPVCRRCSPEVSREAGSGALGLHALVAVIVGVLVAALVADYLHARGWPAWATVPLVALLGGTVTVIEFRLLHRADRQEADRA